MISMHGRIYSKNASLWPLFTKAHVDAPIVGSVVLAAVLFTLRAMVLTSHNDASTQQTL